MKGARFLILVLALLALASVPTAAAPLSDPCPPGTAYHPACDVDQNNQINILDIQRTASRFDQSGTWVSDNQHNHLGQQWTGTGTNNSLKLTGSYGAPDYAPLVLSNTAAGSDGLHVDSANRDGVYVGSANSGVYVNSAVYGLWVNSASDQGLYVGQAGQHGVWVGAAGGTAFYVSSASWGVGVSSASADGVFVESAGQNGVYVQSAGSDGVNANTLQANSQWGFYTDDAIHGSNVLMHSLSLVTQVTGSDGLIPGDIVVAAGVADPVPGSVVRTPLVRLADSSATGIIGVVEGRLAITKQASPAQLGEGETPTAGPVSELRSAEGPAQPGDYVAITVLGVAQVKVQDGEAIQPGQRLTASDTPGHARALRTVQVEGVRVDESGPALGVALNAVKDGLVWVLVNPQ